ncbi:H-NS family nucleoid-associated regulatory protein [Gemmobacter nectariphilus]|uniref:H-NS histone family protein n=1 Tax=Gemmobacter nectariphilus TaxID=220343 RepID=UPI00041D15CE|nr:H-NS histone family protein [Gemmobacter nectariphilus]
MDLDLNAMSLRELKELQVRVDKAVATYEDRRKKEALAELEEKARDMGFSLAELMSLQSSKSSRPRGNSVPKYANPENPSDTWSGRGRKPRWFIDGLASGKSPEDMAI